VTPGAGRQGEAYSAEVTVRGEGNVALWPEPDLRWPPVFRVYPEAAHEQLTMQGGRLSGTKTFTFLLVADSAGALGLPPVRYAYFDLADQRYRVTEGAGAMVIVAPRGEAVASRAEPPPMRLDSHQSIALTIQEALPPVIWRLLALTPPLILLLPLIPRRRRPAAAARQSGDPVRAAERRLSAVLAGASLTPQEATELRSLRDRLQAARYANTSGSDLAALARGAEELLARAEPRAQPGSGRWRLRTGLTALLLFTIGTGSRAQTQPEELYHAGAYRAAVEGFRRRALLSPEVSTNWFNLGDAAYRAGDDAAALAAWVEAARLAPRDPGIRRALQLVAAADPGAASNLWVAPITPAELWLVGLVAWLAGWVGVLIGRRWRGRWVVLLSGGVLFLGAAAGLSRWYQIPVAITSDNEQLRLSPHEMAPAVGEVARLGTVRLGAVRGPWVEVDAGAGQRGWIRRDALEPLAGTLR
jgi:tetratricopeptide (TPR) repeat protein